MSKAEEILRKQFYGDEWDEQMQGLNTDITPSIINAMKEYADYYSKQLPVFKICSHCNTEFQLNVSNAISERVSAFENCTHCGKRNDTWISIKTTEV